MSLVNKQSKLRLLITMIIVVTIFTALIGRVGWLQIVERDKYVEEAKNQQLRDDTIEAERGQIYDRNGKEIVQNSKVNSLWVRPAELKTKKNAKGEKITEEEQIQLVTSNLARILNLDQQTIVDKIKGAEGPLVKISADVSKVQLDEITKLTLPGIATSPKVKRNYIYGDFAAQVIGFTNEDNQGITGLEMEYNKTLSGLPGRWVKNTDINGRQLFYGYENYHEPENGENLKLTLDYTIQHILETETKKSFEETKAKQVYAVAIEIKTGDILGLSAYPTYNLNTPKVPNDERTKAAFDAAQTPEEQQDILSKLWRNPVVSDTYEPGSTFKLITAAMGLEEGDVTPETKYPSPGYLMVEDHMIKSWDYPLSHGDIDLKKAIEISSNTYFMQLGAKIGAPRFDMYLDSFGFHTTTGIDYPGEAQTIIQEKIGPVELANMSFGHGIAVTPISLITALSAIGNEGKMMKPKLVKETFGEDGKTIQKMDNEIISQVISQSTAQELRDMMENEVNQGTGKLSKIEGYRIGGKTGTSTKIVNGTYSNDKVISSFIAMAPMEDPEIAILFIVDEPQGETFGSLVAVPPTKTILESTLRYLEIPKSIDPSQTNPDANTVVEVPNLVGLPRDQGIAQLQQLGLTYEILPKVTDPNAIPDFVIQDQYPKAGKQIKKSGKVYLYRE